MEALDTTNSLPQPRLELVNYITITRGSSCLATPGWETQPRLGLKAGMSPKHLTNTTPDAAYSRLNERYWASRLSFC